MRLSAGPEVPVQNEWKRKALFSIFTVDFGHHNHACLALRLESVRSNVMVFDLLPSSHLADIYTGKLSQAVWSPVRNPVAGLDRIGHQCCVTWVCFFCTALQLTAITI
jgi:hypothetical protein